MCTVYFLTYALMRNLSDKPHILFCSPLISVGDSCDFSSVTILVAPLARNS